MDAHWLWCCCCVFCILYDSAINVCLCFSFPQLVKMSIYARPKDNILDFPLLYIDVVALFRSIMNSMVAACLSSTGHLWFVFVNLMPVLIYLYFLPCVLLHNYPRSAINSCMFCCHLSYVLSFDPPVSSCLVNVCSTCQCKIYPWSVHWCKWSLLSDLLPQMFCFIFSKCSHLSRIKAFWYVHGY